MDLPQGGADGVRMRFTLEAHSPAQRGRTPPSAPCTVHTYIVLHALHALPRLAYGSRLISGKIQACLQAMKPSHDA